jgi:hypothetical protein
MTPTELMAALMDPGAENRHIVARNWLMTGACARFRAAAASVLGHVEQARFLEGRHKELLRQLVQIKKDTMVMRLEQFGDDELREAIRREIGDPPSTLPKPESVSVLLEFDETRRVGLLKALGITASDRGSSNRDHDIRDLFPFDSPALWRLRIELLLAKPVFMIDIGIVLIPVFGLLTVLLPGMRQRWVEKRLGLQAQGGEYPEIEEMRDIAVRHAGPMTVRCNLLRPGIAFVYPGGDRRPRLAVLGGMFALWHRSPEQAKGVLVHEAMHVRRGDYLLVGYGSLFARYLDWLVIGFAGLLALHLVVNMVFSVSAIGLDVVYHAITLGTQMWRAACASLSIFFVVLSKIIVPLLAIWALELNADEGVGRERARYLDFAAQAGGRLSRIHQWAGSLTHPPLWMRRWLLYQDDWRRDVLRQVVFPVSYLIGIVLLLCMGALAKLATGGLTLESILWLLNLGRAAFSEKCWMFGGMAVLILVWPFFVHGWERVFSGAGGRCRRWGSGRIIAASSLAMVAALAWWLR